MKLFHVSTNNKKMNSVDMATNKKHDIKYVFYLFYSATSFEEFLFAFNSDITKACSKEKQWSPEKLAAEAIFEYVRVRKHSESPSRLYYAYFSESYEKAKEFNEKHRSGNAAIFEFTADPKNVYRYDMDIFEDAVKTFENGVTLENYEKVIVLAETYWNQTIHGETEILYKGYPILTRL